MKRRKGAEFIGHENPPDASHLRSRTQRRRHPILSQCLGPNQSVLDEIVPSDRPRYVASEVHVEP